MKRFAFRLEKLLRLRTQQTDQAKRTLAIASAEEAAAGRLLAGAQETLTARLAEVGQKERAGLSACEFASRRTYVKYLNRRVEEAQVALDGARERTAQRRQALLEARRRQRALEKLKERRREAYDLEALREEQKELDEFADRQGLNAGLPPSDN